MKGKLKLKILVMCYCMGAMSCKNDIEVINEVFSRGNSSQERIENVFMSYSDSADIKFELEAPVNIRFSNRASVKDEFPEGVKVRFINRGHVFATLSANHAERDAARKMTILKDNVLLENDQGDRLRTSEMYWDEKVGKIYSQKYAILKSGDQLIQGYGFYTDEDFKLIEIGPSEGRLELEEKR